MTTGSTLNFDVGVAVNSWDPDTDGPVNVYMVYLNDEINRRGSSARGIVDFTYEILGVFTIPDNTIFMSGYTCLLYTSPSPRDA